MSNKNRETAKKEVTAVLSETLPLLRAAMGISQADISEYIGVSRQTYCAMEQNKREMSWSNFLSLFLFFYANEKTKVLMSSRKEFLRKVHDLLQFPAENL